MESFVFSAVRRDSNPSSIESAQNIGSIFWIDTAKGSLHTSKRDGTERRKIFDDLHSPKRLAVDWISENIYWTDDEADVIEMADFDGKYRYKVRLLFKEYSKIHKNQNTVVISYILPKEI
jgi:low-density lipoprotein receptor-related protein 1 (alpha-2-macroglobulin receptor)